ncbi:MAG: aromatic ring-hydroxylating dioxygenase subunit alpha [Acidimicrobiia bacterium]|nr:aromatic ring-hydroxylating dioxygenase subunit alpha [Acidimicrobiia bacterium]
MDETYIVDDPSTSTFRVHRRSMVDDGVLAAERDQIFDQVWLYLGHESEVAAPGDFVTRDVAGRSLVLCRDDAGQVRVWLNSCTHRGASVCREARGHSRFLTCFYHAWSFNLAGELIALPDDAAYGENFDRSVLALVTPPRVDTYRGFVFVSFNASVEPLVDYLAGAREYLDLVCDQSDTDMVILAGTQEYSIKANWKLLVENSIDGYHAMSTHATYMDYLMTAMRKAAEETGYQLGAPDLSGAAFDLGNGHAVIEYNAPWARPVARWLPPLDPALQDPIAARRAELVARYGEERARRICDTSRNLLIFPNLIVNDIMAVTVRAFEPVTPSLMHVRAWELAPLDEDRRLHEVRLDNFLTFLGPGGLATPDDVEALECCQRGFSSWRELPWSDISRGMAQPRPGITDELQMRVFWRRWNELMGGTPQEAAGAARLRVVAER